MHCKTRQAAYLGRRSKPHYYLPLPTDRMFVQAQYTYGHLKRIEEFEARIDWSTWGRSR